MASWDSIHLVSIRYALQNLAGNSTSSWHFSKCFINTVNSDILLLSYAVIFCLLYSRDFWCSFCCRFNRALSAVLTGVVHVNDGFAVRCTSVSRCAVVYGEGLYVLVWRGNAGRLSALVEVPQRFYNRTLGLLGHWSSNRTDDFLLSNGRMVPSLNNNVPSEQSLLPFGQSCAWTLQLDSVFVWKC